MIMRNSTTQWMRKILGVYLLLNIVQEVHSFRRDRKLKKPNNLVATQGGARKRMERCGAMMAFQD
uniref:Uncharacterized protein n=1 Tax=Rhizophora mucronata TaxID=61149 RepID=A0A2P2KUN1_RHIMU